MGPVRSRWFVPVMNSVGDGLSFPVNEGVKRMLWEMRSQGEAVEEEDDRVFRRDESGRWMVHD
jgi:hypothetical protein